MVRDAKEHEELDLTPIIHRHMAAYRSNFQAELNSLADVPALLTEVQRLRAENRRLEWQATPGDIKLAIWLEHLWGKITRKERRP